MKRLPKNIMAITKRFFGLLLMDMNFKKEAAIFTTHI